MIIFAHFIIAVFLVFLFSFGFGFSSKLITSFERLFELNMFLGHFGSTLSLPGRPYEYFYMSDAQKVDYSEYYDYIRIDVLSLSETVLMIERGA